MAIKQKLEKEQEVQRTWAWLGLVPLAINQPSLESASSRVYGDAIALRNHSPHRSWGQPANRATCPEDKQRVESVLAFPLPLLYSFLQLTKSKTWINSSYRFSLRRWENREKQEKELALGSSSMAATSSERRSKQRRGSGGCWRAEAAMDSSWATRTPNLDSGTLSTSPRLAMRLGEKWISLKLNLTRISRSSGNWPTEIGGGEGVIAERSIVISKSVTQPNARPLFINT